MQSKKYNQCKIKCYIISTSNVFILPMLSVCLLLFVVSVCWYTILLFSPGFYYSLSLSLFIHSVTVPSLGSFRSLSLYTALNGKSIHAARLWGPKNSVQQLSIYNGLFMLKRAFHSGPLSCVEPGSRAAEEWAHTAVLESLRDMDLISLIILIIGWTWQAAPLGGEEAGSKEMEEMKSKRGGE